MIRSFFMAAFVLALAACGSSAAGSVGDPCATAGATGDECGSDAVCTPEDTLLICRKICTAQEDCAANEACNGLTGNLKSCQPK
ncbi:MAG: hypothetical protein QM820_49965 [Minicystis sp.]